MAEDTPSPKSQRETHNTHTTAPQRFPKSQTAYGRRGANTPSADDLSVLDPPVTIPLPRSRLILTPTRPNNSTTSRSCRRRLLRRSNSTAGSSPLPSTLRDSSAGSKVNGGKGRLVRHIWRRSTVRRASGAPLFGRYECVREPRRVLPCGGCWGRDGM